MKHLVSFFKHRTSLQSIVSICVFAIVVRIVFIYVFTHFGHGDLLDSTRYIRVAYNILRGRGFAEYIAVGVSFDSVIYIFPLCFGWFFVAGFYPHSCPAQQSGRKGRL